MDTTNNLRGSGGGGSNVGGSGIGSSIFVAAMGLGIAVLAFFLLVYAMVWAFAPQRYIWASNLARLDRSTRSPIKRLKDKEHEKQEENLRESPTT